MVSEYSKVLASRESHSNSASYDVSSTSTTYLLCQQWLSQQDSEPTGCHLLFFFQIIIIIVLILIHCFYVMANVYYHTITVSGLVNCLFTMILVASEFGIKNDTEVHYDRDIIPGIVVPNQTKRTV